MVKGPNPTSTLHFYWIPQDSPTALNAFTLSVASTSSFDITVTGGYWAHHLLWTLKFKRKSPAWGYFILRYEWLGLPRGLSSQESSCQCRRHRRHGFDPWVGKIPWRRAWQPTPVFLPGESHGQESLAGYSPWDRKKLDTTEHAYIHTHTHTHTHTVITRCSQGSWQFNVNEEVSWDYSLNRYVCNIFLLMNYYARFWNYVKSKKKIVSGLRELIVVGQWTLWWLMLCVKRPGPWAAQIFSLTLFWVFGDVTNIRICRLSKADCHPQCGWASSNHWKVWIEQKGWVRRNFSSDPLRWTAVCSCLWTCTGIYTFCSLGSSACWLQILRLFSASIVTCANSL